jgi:hypothetical protein
MQEAYPTQLKFDYTYESNEAPFDIKSIYHDDKFTYIKTSAPEKFSVYEMKDGKPNFIGLSRPLIRCFRRRIAGREGRYETVLGCHGQIGSDSLLSLSVGIRNPVKMWTCSSHSRLRRTPYGESGPIPAQRAGYSQVRHT